MTNKIISGFSKLSKEEKLRIISSSLSDGTNFVSDLEALNHRRPDQQIILEQFSENTLGNFPMPYGVAPNFLINNKWYTIPMVTEESSVVAAASAAAGFWAGRGGFHAKVKGSVKIGQIHFCWKLKKEILIFSQEELKVFLLDNTVHLTQSMVNRGGGIHDITLIDLTEQLDNYFQLRIEFDTADSMGANFINSVLEEMALLVKRFFHDSQEEMDSEGPVEIIMAILSNYTPNCIVECYVETSIDALDSAVMGLKGVDFVRKFKMAMDIATFDPYRAVTHNKGIFNGIDAVVLATANDFRAVEAAGHAYASRNGSYSSLSKVDADNNHFRMSLELPMSVGTVGGLTSLHPLAKWSFELLNKPNAPDLMMIIASAGLANNFSAIRSLISSGIQQGHMKMHLGNILSFLGAGNDNRVKAMEYFKNHTVSHYEVQKFLDNQKVKP